MTRGRLRPGRPLYRPIQPSFLGPGRVLGQTDTGTTRVNIGPTFIIIFINDLVDICGENVILYLFADDAKMYCHIKDVADKNKLKRGIEKFVKEM